jgi:hypothetical protein
MTRSSLTPLGIDALDRWPAAGSGPACADRIAIDISTPRIQQNRRQSPHIAPHDGIDTTLVTPAGVDRMPTTTAGIQAKSP